jgi:quercetin dioxygenase-like cupin family protein
MNAERKNFQHPDETRSFEKGKLELLRLGGGVVGRLTLEPGWRWSEHVRPIAKTKWCEAPHFQYQLAGRLHIKTAAGHEFETSAGDVTALPSGHDAWVVGNEAVVLIDWSGAADYAKQTTTKPSVGPSDSRGGRVTVP